MYGVCNKLDSQDKFAGVDTMSLAVAFSMAVGYISP